MKAAELAALHGLCFRVPRPWSVAEFDTLARDPAVTILAENDAFLVMRAGGGEAEILTLAVHPERRRRGLGSSLLQQAEELARQAGAEAIFLEVADGNIAALGLYLAAGWSEAGRRKGYYSGEDALVLKKNLRPGDATF